MQIRIYANLIIKVKVTGAMQATLSFCISCAPTVVSHYNLNTLTIYMNWKQKWKQNLQA